MLLRTALVATTALVLAATPSLAQSQRAPSQAVAAAQAEAERAKLFALFEDADARELALNPLSRILRGEYENARRLGDFDTDAFFIAGRTDTQLNLAKLALIDRSKLAPNDALAYDVFRYNQEQALRLSSEEMRALTEVRPVNHFTGFHTFYPTFASGAGAAPFDTLAHYEDNLARHDDYIAITGRAIARSRQGMASGVVETKLTIRNAIAQLDALLATPLADSQFMGPIKNFPEGISETDRARLTAAYEAKTREIYAAHAALRDFLRDEYLGAARSSVGLSEMKGGAELYALLVEQTTTLPVDAETIHQLGLREVARIKSDLEIIKAEVGYDGTLNEFFDYVRTDPRFQPESREALAESFYQIGREVDAKVGEYFTLIPKSPLKIEPFDPAIEQFRPTGSYMEGTPDGSRPGTFYYNTYDLPSRLTTLNVTLYLHEGAPGHHFQISLAQENADLPAFMRFGGTTSFVEGWALYAETLGYEMGFYEDPWNRYGTLQAEQLRALRLVVDTGLHAKGWTREEAIDFMLENSGLTRTEVVLEVERYIAMPSQALAYKVGALKIQELRERSQEKLGERFDIKAFHEQILNTGGLPLAVLEQKVDRWIAEQTR